MKIHTFKLYEYSEKYIKAYRQVFVICIRKWTLNVSCIDLIHRMHVEQLHAGDTTQ